VTNKHNPRRDGPKNEKRTETGPRYENANPGHGCNSTHVAKSRKDWSDIATRSERRTGKTSPKVNKPTRERPPVDFEDSLDM